jgi:hypothetical protein
LYVPDTAEGRRQTFSTLLIEASIHTTNALVVAEQTQLAPVSDDPYFCQLLSLRTSAAQYVPQSAPLASIVGLAIAKSVLPDEVLSKLKMQDLFEYRTSAKEAYSDWSAEVERLAQRLLDVPPDRIDSEVAKLIISDVRPRLIELRHALASARDKLFGDLIKTATRWEMPTLSLAYLVGLNLPTALAAFAAALAPAVPAVVDYFMQRRDLVRRNSLAYLVGVSKLAEDERA